LTIAERLRLFTRTHRKGRCKTSLRITITAAYKPLRCWTKSLRRNVVFPTLVLGDDQVVRWKIGTLVSFAALMIYFDRGNLQDRLLFQGCPCRRNGFSSALGAKEKPEIFEHADGFPGICFARRENLTRGMDS